MRRSHLNQFAWEAQDYIVKGQITTQLLVRTIRYAIERSQTFQMLRESERRFRAIFDSSFQLTKLLTPEGIVLEVNETALEFTGMRLEDIVGQADLGNGDLGSVATGLRTIAIGDRLIKSRRVFPQRNRLVSQKRPNCDT